MKAFIESGEEDALSTVLKKKGVKTLEKKINTNEQDAKLAELFERVKNEKPEIMPMICGYIAYLAEQHKAKEVKCLCSSGEIYTANDTMRILSQQPLEYGRFNVYVPEVLEAFQESLSVSNFELVWSLYTAGVMDGIHRERERRRRPKRSI